MDKECSAGRDVQEEVRSDHWKPRTKGGSVRLVYSSPWFPRREERELRIERTGYVLYFAVQIQQLSRVKYRRSGCVNQYRLTSRKNTASGCSETD